MTDLFAHAPAHDWWAAVSAVTEDDWLDSRRSLDDDHPGRLCDAEAPEDSEDVR